MKVDLMVIVIFVITLVIRIWIVESTEEEVLDVRFLSFGQYDLRILFERITCTTIITRDKRHKEFSLGKP